MKDREFRIVYVDYPRLKEAGLIRAKRLEAGSEEEAIEKFLSLVKGRKRILWIREVKESG